jgi:UDP-N-acetylmuramoylalanine--D-glutamate ligase
VVKSDPIACCMSLSNLRISWLFRHHPSSKSLGFAKIRGVQFSGPGQETFGGCRELPPQRHFDEMLVTLPDNETVSRHYAGRSATVMGLGRFGGGLAAAQFLAKHGARVTVTDLRTESELADSLSQFCDTPIERFVLGQHTEDAFRDCQLLVVNPAVKPENDFVIAARSRGAEVTTEIELFLRHNPAPVIAVSGSNGKSTTTALIHHLLTLAGGKKTFGKLLLGGNIGISLLSRLPEITADDMVILELSSFQLEFLRHKRFRPKIAVLTNFSPNHLDWHGTEAAYRTAKQGLFDSQTSDDVAIVPDCDATDSHWRTRGQRLQFGLQDHGEDGAFLEDGTLILRSARSAFEDVVRIAIPAQLPGDHNRLNVAAAACAAWQAGADPDHFSDALRSFQPLPHRLQRIAERAGRQFWNDSIATTPESAIMALRVFSNPVVLMAGGYDKSQDLSPFAAEARHRAKAVVLMGQTAAQLKSLLQSHDVQPSPAVVMAQDFKEAFAQAVELSQPGDIVLLSPGCASYGWFRDYRERGELFTKLAKEWRPVE